MLRKNMRVVNIAQLRRNLTAIRGALQGGTLLMAVVKADAYGHGMVEVARMAQASGADWLGVSMPEEGIALRENGITLPILVLGAAFDEGIEACIRHQLTQTVTDAGMVRKIGECAARLQTYGDVHIKIDTGMNRIGVKGEAEYRAVLEAVLGENRLRLTGVYTHFADADGEDETFSRAQLNAFIDLTGDLPPKVCRHAANSAAFLRLDGAQLDMVRAGIALYGCPPVETNLPIKSAMEWVSEVVHLKTIVAGETVSYGRTYTACGDRVIATLPVGYGDGYHRAASNRGRVIIEGCYADIVGRICMDQMMVDVTGIENVRLGSEAVLVGTRGGKTITPDDLAQASGTICYEVLLAPTSRVPRIFKEDD